LIANMPFSTTDWGPHPGLDNANPGFRDQIPPKHKRGVVIGDF